MSRAATARQRFLHLLEVGLRGELNERSAAHSRFAENFRFAEAAAKEHEERLNGHEAELRAWLSDDSSGLDLQTLRLFHSVLDHGREEYASAARAAETAAIELENSRAALFQSLQRRTKLRDVRQRRVREEVQQQGVRAAAQLDELWLQNKVRKS